MKNSFLTRYNHKKVSVKSVGKTLTDIQYIDDCSIDKVLRKYGAIPPQPVLPYDDVSKFGDFADVLEYYRTALESFKSQPAELRARFGNRPEAFFDFVSNPANEQECIALGLRVTPPKAVEAAPAAESAGKHLTIIQPTDTKTEEVQK